MSYYKNITDITMFGLRVSLIFFLWAFQSNAQDSDDSFSFDEDSVLLGEDAAQTKSSSNLAQYFIGELGYNTASNPSSERTGRVFNVGLDVPTNWGRVYLSYGATQSQLTLRQKLNDGLEGDPNLELDETRTIEIETDESDFKDAFVQTNLGNIASISAGRQRNAWGQFELFSPSATMLPKNSTITSLVPSKLDFLYPQDQTVLSIFPTSKMEMQFFTMSDVRTDPTLDEAYETWLAPSNNSDKDFINSDFNSENLFDENGNKSQQSQMQTAFRMLLYPNWGTFGITYHKGINADAPVLHAPVRYIKPPVIANQVPLPQTIGSDYRDEEETFIFYPEGGLVSFELSIPVGAWVWRYEYAQIDSIAGLGFNGNINLSSSTGRPADGNLLGGNNRNGFANGDAFIDALNDEDRDPLLRGTSLYHATTDVQTIGFLYEGRKWTTNVMLLSKQSPKPKNAADQEIVRLYEALEQEQEGPPNDTETEAPIISTFRTAGDEDQHRFGFNVGVVGSGTGYSFIYRYNITESINVALSVGEVDLSNGQSSDRYYQAAEEGGITTQFTFGWYF